MTGARAEGGEPGAQLVRAVQIMDRLRSPGGCPWDAEQTHSSLAPYLIEEAYETLEAIETADLAALREELGDLLLQVLFHARLAEEAATGQRFTIDDVAADLVAKLVRRHPHVFAESEDGAQGNGAQGNGAQGNGAQGNGAQGNGAQGNGAQGPSSADQQQTNWDAIKKAEKQRESVTDGIAMGQPALALAAKLVSRSERAGLAVAPPAGDGIGDQLLALVGSAVRAGVDPEQALRESAREYAGAIRARETAGRDNATGE
ncbi:MAG TPA: MazG family protein [Jatrophihabitans sp.]|uniref:MazG family protein n=1 Tax=Jatrophihabitans sp. TaxID=1932789 RepID=UPI002EFEF0CE